jgi:hypothetical protein
MPVNLATRNGRDRRIDRVQDQLRKMLVRPYFKKQNKNKRVGNVAQTVEHVPSKDNALSLVPSTRKKGREGGEERGRREGRKERKSKAPA